MSFTDEYFALRKERMAKETKKTKAPAREQKPADDSNTEEGSFEDDYFALRKKRMQKEESEQATSTPPSQTTHAPQGEAPGTTVTTMQKTSVRPVTSNPDNVNSGYYNPMRTGFATPEMVNTMIQNDLTTGKAPAKIEIPSNAKTPVERGMSGPDPTKVRPAQIPGRNSYTQTAPNQAPDPMLQAAAIADQLAAEKEKELADYLASDDAKNKSANVTVVQGNDPAAAAGSYIGSLLGNFFSTGNAKGDTKQEQIEQEIAYFRGISEKARNQHIMQKDLAEYETWPDADKDDMKVYYTSLNVWGVPDMRGSLAGDRLANKYGKETFKRIAESYVLSQNRENMQQITDFIKEHTTHGDGLLAIPIGIAGDVFSVTDYIGQYAKTLFGGTTGRYAGLDANAPGQMLSNVADVMMQEEGKNFVEMSQATASNLGADEKSVEAIGKIANTVYGAGMSALENITKVAVTGGVGTLALAATAGFSQGVTDATLNGASSTQAILMGIVNGATEVLTEKLSLDNLLGSLKNAGSTQGFKAIVKEALKQGAVEVSEEELNFIVGLLGEAVILQDKSGYNQTIQELMAQGVTYEEAVSRANQALLQEAGMIAVQSALSGMMVSAGGRVVSNRVSTATDDHDQQDEQNKQSGQEVVQGVLDGLRPAQKPQGVTEQENQELPGLKLPTVEESAQGNAEVMSDEEFQERYGLKLRAVDDLQNSVTISQSILQQTRRLSSVLGREIEVYSKDTDGNGIENGYYKDGKIYVNEKGADPVAQTVSHELTHSIENVAVYGELSQLVLERMKTDGINLTQVRQKLKERYARNGVELVNDTEIDKEIVADYVSKNLLTNEQEITALVKEQPSLGRNILNWLDRLLAKLGNKNAQERAFLNRARELYVKALRQTQRSFEEAKWGAVDTEQESQRQNPTGSEVQEALLWARQQYANGNMTDEEFELFIDSIMEWEEMNQAAETAEVKRSISPTFVSEIDQWNKTGMPDGESFELGMTGDVLQGLGAIETDIYMLGDKIQQILSDHPEMTLKEIKKIPQILEDPVLILKSRNAGRGNASNNRLVIFGTIKAQNGQPMLAVLDLRPVEKNLVVDDMQKVTSAYTKTSNPREFIIKSDVLYADKNRTARLLKSIGFHMPIELQQSGYIGSISYFKRSVNISGEKFSKVIALKNETGYSRGTGDQENLTDGQPSYGATPVSEEMVPQEGSVVKEQYSIGDSTIRKQDVISDLRSILARGGSTAELRQYIARMEGGDRDSGRESGKVNPNVAKQSGAQQIIKSAEKQGISIEEYLQQNWEQYDVDGVWNADAREALDLERGGRQYSIAEDTREEKPEKTAADRDSLPAKAKDYLKRAERTLLNNIAKKLCVPYYAKRQYLQEIVEDISNAYLKDGIIPGETAERLFDKAYEQGIVIDTEFYDQYKDVKEHMRTTAVSISDTDKADIADFGDFRKKALGTLRIVNEGGIPVDSYYRELQEMAQELFPDYITHPADQLQRMYEVARSIQRVEKTLKEYHGKDADAFKRWAKMDFDSAIEDAAKELYTVKRYADEQNAKEETAPVTPGEAMEVYAKLKDARRTYEKVAAKNLLTEHDEAIIGDLLKGKRTLESLDPEEDNVKGIAAVYEAKQELEEYAKLIAEYKRTLRKEMRDMADKHLETANDWKDKKVGIAYSRETMRRNVQDIVKDSKVADEVNRTFFEPVAVAEAASTRFKEQYRSRVKRLGISRKVEKGNAVSEAHAVQLLGEAMDNIAMIERARGRLKNRDGKTLTEWQAVISALWEQSPGLDQEKVKNAVNEFRKIYDELFTQMNEVRVANGYEPVNYRKGYFPHFQPGECDGILAHFGKALGISTEVVALPTTINGLTHTFKPGIQWLGNAQERLGFNTVYDAVEGFDKYIEGVSGVIHQTENIQRLRALASQIRYRTSDDGIRNQVDKVNVNDKLTEEEKQALISEIYSKGRFTLSNFVVELDEYTNLLANKKSKLDRTVEAALGRRFYSFMKRWESRVGANMIAGNLSSALTNFIPLQQAGAQLDKGVLMSGMWNTLRSIKQSDTLLSRSDFITNRRGSDPLVRTWVQKASNVAGKPMELIDSFVSESIVRAAYYQNLKRGLSESEAMHQADIFAAGVMADRSKGAMPTLFESHNPLFKAFTQFQLEVNNQFSEVFKDLPRTFRGKSLFALAGVLLKYFLGAFLFNDLYEWLFGRRPALDPFGILNETVGDFTGYELPNLLDLGIGAVTGDIPSFETEQVGVGEAVKNLGSNVLSELPFASGLTLIGVETDGGRIPASSAVPDLTALVDAATKTEWSAEKRWKEAADEFAKPLTYLALPFGGGNQIAKTWKGLEAYFKGGSYTVDSEGNDILQYPVYKDSIEDAVGNALKAGVMGKSSLREAQDWVDSGFDSFSARQTATYQDMLEANVTDRAAYGLLIDLQEAEKTDEQSKAEIQCEIIRKSNISNEGKAIAYYGIVASAAERELMDKLTDMGADSGETGKVVMNLRETSDLKGQEKKQTRADMLLNSYLTDEEKSAIIQSFLGSELVNESGNPTQYAKFLSATEAGLEVDRYLAIYGADANIDDYFDLVDGGMNCSEAANLLVTLTEQFRKESKEDMKQVEKWRICVDMFRESTDQLAALSMVMTDAQLEKAEMANKYGVQPKVYVEFYEIRKSYDNDGNSSYTQAEIKAAVDSLGKKCTTEQKAVLWQLATGAKSAKNNPYSVAVGQKIVDAKQAAKDAEAELPKLILGGAYS